MGEWSNLKSIDFVYRVGYIVKLHLEEEEKENDLPKYKVRGSDKNTNAVCLLLLQILTFLISFR